MHMGPSIRDLAKEVAELMVNTGASARDATERLFPRYPQRTRTAIKRCATTLAKELREQGGCREES